MLRRELHLQELRQRDHEQQHQQRHPEVTQRCQPCEREHEAADRDDKATC